MLKWIYVFLAATFVLNALWMLLAPLHWYANLPAAVPDTGPFNPHFVRDIGVAFLTTAVALGWAARDLPRAYPLHVVATVFIVGHGLLHVWDILAGRLPMSHWVIDLPGVFVPAALMGWLAVPSVWRRMAA